MSLFITFTARAVYHHPTYPFNIQAWQFINHHKQQSVSGVHRVKQCRCMCYQSICRVVIIMDQLKKLLFTILLIHFMCTMLDVGFSIESLARESTCFCNSHWRAYLQILNACICVLNSMLIGTGVGYLLNHIYDCPVAKPFISFPLMSDCSCILCTEPASNSNATPMKDQSSQANFTRPIGSEPRSLPPLPLPLYSNQGTTPPPHSPTNNHEASSWKNEANLRRCGDVVY